jgi:DNA-binding transcriptional LysR family regulator
MDVSGVEAFLVLAEELHFTRTAERLRLSQSRVSRLISSLERRVGGLLFERTSRRVAPTPLGRRLRNRVGPAWTEIGAAFAEARAAAGSTSGTLRIGWPVTAGGPALTRLAQAFGAGHPECELAVEGAENLRHLGK